MSETKIAKSLFPMITKIQISQAKLTKQKGGKHLLLNFAALLGSKKLLVD